jgi:hypothetical protein
MALELSRKHLTKACERIDVWGSQLLTGGPTGAASAGITLPPAKVNAYLAALGQVLTEDGREADATETSRQVRLAPKGRAVIAYWVGATFTD